jgi:PAS domain S-box-containing protein
VDGKYGVTDLVDLDKLRAVFEKFTRATGFTIGFLDHPGLDVLIATGWRDVCTKFHRGCPSSQAVCHDSNARLLNGLDHPGALVVEPCGHGLVDCATPIIVRGVHVASLATGQMLLQPPDLERFRAQARTFGYDEEAYLAALAEVPVVSEERLRDVTAFLGELAVTISEMGYAALETREERTRLEREVAERRRVESSLRESESLYRSLVETTSTGYVTVDLHGRVLDANREYVRLTGHDSLGDIRGRAVTEWTAPHHLEKNEAAVASCGQEGKVRNFQVDYVDARGAVTPIEINATLVEVGGTHQILTLCRDITERRRAETELQAYRDRLEDLVKQRTGELRAAITELEAFSYTVSHDLRSPLRSIDGFSALLVEEYGGKLDEEGLRLLGTVRRNVQRMGRLIEDLLAFSHLGRGRMVVEEVDMTAAARSAMDRLLEGQVPERKVRFELQDLPAAHVDPGMVQQVWTNLLDNALKFTRPMSEPLVQVGGSVEGGEAIYHVRDNGVGFDMRYKDRLFGVFQRLHGDAEFEGTGIGLSIVHRVVTRHQGRVWAESVPGQGATFSFALPRLSITPHP